MKSNPIFDFIVAMAMSVMLSGAALAQTSGNVSEMIRQDMILDYGQKVRDGNTGGPAAQGMPSLYAKEGEQLASQLQVISDNEDVNYTIVDGDTLAVTFMDREQANRAAYKVSSTGEIFMPLLGAVKVAGLNRKQARERVEMMLKEYIREPQVHIAINAEGRVMVFGAVMGPGIYNLNGKMSVMETVLAAGGAIKQSAEMGSVIVVRGPVEKPVILKLNLKKMLVHGDRSDDIPVKPGDFVYVPTSFISNLDSFWNATQGLLMRWYGLGGSQPIKNRGTFAW
ncbi:MAG: polysaccharide biosynthesis/export family protein [Candidatus Omnitrophica bacterium]|nr:polysaccharide biosynthesis/export family protein [Candidatus Omnitrophota bacterium]